MNLQDNTSRLMVVRLTRHNWEPRKLDSKASNQVTEANGAAKGAARVWKDLLNKGATKGLKSEMTAVRETHLRFTSPWSDDGERVLASELFFDYTSAMRKHDDKIQKLAREFEDVYPQLVEARRSSLGSLYNEADYPNASEIRGRFGIETRFEPLPNPEDTRVWGIGAEAAEEIEQQVRKDIETTLEKSQQDIVERVQKAANEFIDKVNTYDAKVSKGERASLYSSAISNLRDVTTLVIRGLNVTGGADLEKLASDLDSAFKGINIDKLKHSESARKDKTAEVAATLAKFKGVF